MSTFISLANYGIVFVRARVCTLVQVRCKVLQTITSIYCFGVQKSFKMLQQVSNYCVCGVCVCVWSTAEKSQELVTAIHQSLYLAILFERNQRMNANGKLTATENERIRKCGKQAV